MSVHRALSPSTLIQRWREGKYLVEKSYLFQHHHLIYLTSPGAFGTSHIQLIITHLCLKYYVMTYYCMIILLFNLYEDTFVPDVYHKQLLPGSEAPCYAPRVSISISCTNSIVFSNTFLFIHPMFFIFKCVWGGFPYFSFCQCAWAQIGKHNGRYCSLSAGWS